MGSSLGVPRRRSSRSAISRADTRPRRTNTSERVARRNPPSIRENAVYSSKNGLRQPAPSPSPPGAPEPGVQTALDDVVKNNVQTPTVIDAMPETSEALLTEQEGTPRTRREGGPSARGEGV